MSGRNGPSPGGLLSHHEKVSAKLELVRAQRLRARGRRPRASSVSERLAGFAEQVWDSTVVAINKLLGYRELEEQSAGSDAPALR
jgi:hypothetical protein